MAALSRAHTLPAEFHVGVLFENSAPDTAQRSEIMRQASRLLPVMLALGDHAIVRERRKCLGDNAWRAPQSSAPFIRNLA